MNELIAGSAAPKLKAIERVRDLLSKITYKPGWVITADYDLGTHNEQIWWSRFRRIILTARYKATDVFDSQKEIMLCNRCSLEEWDIDHLDDRQIVDYFIRRVIYEAEDHEFKEWFKFDGICVFDPHPKEDK